ASRGSTIPMALWSSALIPPGSARTGPRSSGGRGRKAYEIESHRGKDTMEVAGMVAKIIDAEEPERVFIDVGGLGAGEVDRRRELGYGSIISPVNAGEKPVMDSERFINRRAEMWSLLRDWLKEQPAEIPDSDTLHADLVGPGYSYDSNQRLRLEQ